MKKTAIVILTLSIITAGAVWAMPFGPDGGGQRHSQSRGMGNVLHNPRIMEKLGLGDEEVSALRKLQYEEQKEMISLEADLQLARLEKRRLLEQEQPDREAVMKAIEAVGNAQTAVQKARADHMLKVRELLGIEKMAKLHEMRQSRRRSGEGQGRQGKDRKDRGDRKNSRRGQYGRRGQGYQHQPPFEDSEEEFEEAEGDIVE